MLIPKLKRSKDTVILSLNDVHLNVGYLSNKKKTVLSIDVLTNHSFNGIRLDLSQAMEVINKTHSLLSNNHKSTLSKTHNILGGITVSNEQDTYSVEDVMKVLKLTVDDINRLCQSGDLVRVEVLDFVDNRLTISSVHKYVMHILRIQ